MVSLAACFLVSSCSRPSDRGDPGCCCRRPSQRREGQRGGPSHADSAGGRAVQHCPCPGVEGGDGYPAQQQPQGDSDAPALTAKHPFELFLQPMFQSCNYLTEKKVKISSRKMSVAHFSEATVVDFVTNEKKIFLLTIFVVAVHKLFVIKAWCELC